MKTFRNRLKSLFQSAKSAKDLIIEESHPEFFEELSDDTAAAICGGGPGSGGTGGFARLTSAVNLTIFGVGGEGSGGVN